MYKRFTDKPKSIVKENVPHKPRRVNNCKPLWMTKGLQKRIAEKRKAYKKYKLSGTASDFNSYTILERSCEKEIRKTDVSMK